MVASCSVINCTNSKKNKSKNVTFHRFPLSKPKLCKQWVLAIQRQNFKPSPHHLICSDHFEKSCFLPGYVNRKQLKKNAVPSLFHVSSHYAEEKCSPSEPEKEESKHESSTIHQTILSNENEAPLDSTEPLETHSGITIKEEPVETNIDLLCRACAHTCEELVSVFGDKGSELQLLEKIHIHLPIMVTPEDFLPVTLCTSCIYKLELCHDFAQGCMEADAKLRTLLGLEIENTMYNDGYSVEFQSGTIEEPSLEIKEELPDESNDNTNIFGDSADHQLNNVVQIQNSNKKSCDETSECYMQKLMALDDSDSKLNETKNTKILSEVSEIHAETSVRDTNGDDDATKDLDNCDVQMQEGSVNEELGDQQNLPHTKNADSPAVPRNSRGSVRLRKLKRKRKKMPKFKVVIVKMKNSTNLTDTAQFKKALDFAMNTGKPNMSSIMKVHSDEQLIHKEDQSSVEALSTLKSSITEYSPECPVHISETSFIQPPTFSIKKKTKLEEVNQQSPTSISEDHTYSHKKQSLYCCMYCRKTVTTKDSLISHQVSSHPDKIFYCEQCNTVYHCRKMLDDHKKCHLIEEECARSVKQNPNHQNKLQPTVHVGKLKPLFLLNENTTVNEVIVGERKEQLESKKSDLINNSTAELSVPKFLANGNGHADNIPKQNGQAEFEEIKVVDVHIEPEQIIQNKGTVKLCVKLSKEFGNIDQSHQSKILERLNKIIEKNSEFSEMGVAIPKRLKCETREKILTPQIKIEKTVRKWKKVWTCNYCSHISTSHRKFQEHRRLHSRLIYTCSYCKKQFPSQKSLSGHVYLLHTDEKNFTCECCGKSYRFWHSLRDHLFVHDKGEKVYKCDECGREFGSKSSYDSHCTSHTEASYLCDICGKSMKYITSLRMHKRTHDDPNCRRKYSCEFCGKSYQSRPVLEDHVRIHTNERPYQCSVCGKCFRMRSQLSNHNLIHANARQHKCSVCGKGFNRQQHLKVHIRTHQRPLTYTCRLCHQPFTNVGDLIIHRRSHTQEEIDKLTKQQALQAFLCQICGKQLGSKFTLKNHVMLHADDKPFTCKICKKSFAMKSTLQTHQRVHTGERPHSCRYCCNTFLSKQHLVIHERLHTGETPFECTQCDKSYRSRHSLQQHILLHLNYRPFQCPQCEKRFRRQDILATHMRIHTGERPYVCTICGRAFKQKGDCNKHQQRHIISRRNTSI